MSTTAVVKKPKVAKTASHPPYFQLYIVIYHMIKGALLALNEKSGSSTYAIAKHMEEKQKAVLPSNFRKSLALQLKNSAAKGKLIKIKSSFKLSEAGKKDMASKKKKKKVVKAKAVKKPAKTEKKKIAKKAKVVKTVAAKKKAEIAKKVTKPAAKKRSVSIAKAKQPKSIKSPASKKAKRAPAKA